MAEQIESYKVLCNGGLDTSENHLALSENASGSATRLVNYEVSLFGGYRRINGFTKYDNTYSEVGVNNANGSGVLATGQVLGVFIYKNLTTNADVVIAARKDTGANTYSFYYFVANSGWTKFNTGLTLATTDGVRTVTKIRHVVFNFGSGNQLCFVDGVNPALVYDGTNWKQITSSGAGTTSSYGGPNALNTPSLVDVFENTLFLGGDRTSQATVAYSTPNTPYDWITANGAGQLAVGYKVVQFKPFRDNLFIFGSNEIKKASPDTTAGFVLDNVTANVGCIATDSVLEIGGDLVFLAPDGVRPVSGTSRIGDVEIESISKNAQALFSTLPEQYNLDTLNGVVIRGKSQLRYFIGDSTTPTGDSYGIIGGLRTADQRLGWEWGELLGIRTSCVISGFIGNSEVILHGDYDGKIYKQEVGNSFNGQNIIGIYATPYLDYGDTEVRKILRKVNTFVRAEGPLTIGLSFDYDWGDDNTPRPASYEDSSAGAPVRYNDTVSEYGDANVVYGGADKPVFTTTVQGSGFSARTTFVTNGQFAPHSIQGVVYEFSISGRN